MKTKQAETHSGSTFASFLEEEGYREEIETIAINRVLAWITLMRGLRQTARKAAAPARANGDPSIRSE